MSGAILALLLYLLIVISVGLLVSRRSGRNQGEFYLGGRGMGEVVVALSAVVSGRSAWLMMGVVGATFLYGVRMAWFIPGYVIAELAMFLFAARRIRHFTEEHDCITFVDYFTARFPSQARALRITAAVIITIFFTAYVGAQLKAGQVMFNHLFGWESVLAGVGLMAGIVGFYTIVGGFRAVSITDAIQAVLMIAGLVVLPIVAFAHAGGIGAAWETLRAEGSGFSMAGIGSLVGVVSGLGIGLGSPGNPHIIVRYMSIERPERLRVSALVGTIWNVLLGWGAVYTGLAARALYRPELFDNPSNQAFVHMATDLFPPVLAGLMLAALLAAIMSTADSQILVVSSSITHDLCRRPSVALGKLTVAIVILAAGCLSWLTAAGGGDVFQTVFSYVLLAWSGLGASFGPPLLLSLFWRRASGAGALLSFLSGTAGCVLWIALGFKASTGLHEIVPAFALSTLMMVVGSLAVRKKGGPPSRTR